MSGCVFCRIVAGIEPHQLVRRWGDAVAIEPLDPVTPGHVLVIPAEHVTDATVDPDVTAKVMRRAADLAQRPCNIITSAGPEATQTIAHLHLHIVPRRPGDGLALPWTSQKAPADVLRWAADKIDAGPDIRLRPIVYSTLLREYADDADDAEVPADGQ